MENPTLLTEKELFQNLSSSKVGLTNHEAAKRLRQNGPNTLRDEGPSHPLAIFSRQYKNPLVLILIVASLVSFFTGERLDGSIIILMLFLNSLLGFVQEFRSEKAAALLKKKASLKATVLREGKEEKILASELVVGDLVKISQGSIIPADLRFIATKNLTIDESIVTGESFPVEKTADPLQKETNLPQDELNVGFMGTSVQSGTGLGLVFAISKDTELGKTSASLSSQELPTEFQVGTKRFSNLLVVLIIILVVFIFIVNVSLKPILFHQNPAILEALLFSLALAIGITPELLPLIITLNLSRGALLMSKKHAIVKKLIAIEDIGNADVLCTDKTGTITEGKIFLENYLNYEGKLDSEILLYALLSNSQESLGGAGSLDQALVDYPGTKEIQPAAKAFSHLDELPFDFERRRTTTLVSDGKKSLILSKGATEPMLALCSQVKIEGETKILLESYRRALREKFIQLSSQGFRVLAVAGKEVAKIKKIKKEDEKNLIFYGFLAFSDRPKHTAAETLQDLAKLSVQVKILTGDNEYVSRHLCQEVGLAISGVATGEAIDDLSNEELKKLVNKTSIFAKITPDHKLRIIKAIKENGHTVAFLGDGANDAPALKTADVGISVDSALDVAKEAADIILLRKSLEVLIEAVKDGRRTFGNSMKYVYEASSSNFGNMFSLAAASLFLPFIPMLPSQVILLNFMGDLPSLTISSDNVDSEYLRKPKHWNIHAITDFMIPFGLLSSLFDFTTFFLLLYLSQHLAKPQNVFRTGWFFESLLTEIFVIYLIRTQKPFWKSRPSNLMILVGILSFLAGVLVVFSPLGYLFQFVPLPKNIIFFIALIVGLYIILFEIGKAVFYKKVKV